MKCYTLYLDLKGIVIDRIASYIYLTEEEWHTKLSILFKIAEHCELCPRKCNVNRLKSQFAFCGASDKIFLSSIFPHHGEEPPISGNNGSGTVFFSYCTLKCCFCQNYQISHEHEGTIYSEEELAEDMLLLQHKGCHNINLVSPTHFLPWIISALKKAAFKGLTIPLVYNCSGYESDVVIGALNGIIDIFLPDMKYGDNSLAQKYSHAHNYVEVNQNAIRTMFRQVGPLKTDSEGIAYRGLIIRHLVLPSDQSSSYKILDFLKSNFDPQDICISIMAQYRPLFRADNFNQINRMITFEEYESVKLLFTKYGFQCFFQEIEKIDQGFIIDFKKRKKQALTGDGQDI